MLQGDSLLKQEKQERQSLEDALRQLSTKYRQMNANMSAIGCERDLSLHEECRLLE